MLNCAPHGTDNTEANTFREIFNMHEHQNSGFSLPSSSGSQFSMLSHKVAPAESFF